MKPFKSYLVANFFLLFCSLLVAQTNDVLEAVQQGDFLQLKSLVLPNDTTAANILDENGASLLMWSAYKGELEMVRYLVEAGADIHHKGVIWIGGGKESWLGSLLNIAAFKGDLALTRYLIEELGINPKDQGYDHRTDKANGLTAYEFALLAYQLPILNYLERYQHPLLALISNFQLATERNLQVLSVSQYLLLAPNSIHTLDEQGRSALHLAAADGNTPIIEVLLNANATIDLKDEAGNTPLHLSAQKAKNECAQLLLQKGASVDAQNKQGNTPLILAAAKGNKQLVKLLLDAGANSAINNHKGQDAKKVAPTTIRPLFEIQVDYFEWIKLGRSQQVITAVQQGKVKVDNTDKDGNTLLHLAVTYGVEPLVNTLIEEDWAINKQRKNGSTPLMIAVYKNLEAITKLLLEKGADPHVHRPDKFTALHLAAQWGAPSIVKMLLESNVAINIGAVDQNTPLLFAAYYNRPQIVELLLSYSAQINQVNDFKMTAIHSCFYGYNDLSSVITNKNISSEDKQEEYLQLEEQHWKTVNILLKHGADLQLKDIQGYLPLDLSENFGIPKVTDLLRSYNTLVEPDPPSSSPPEEKTKLVIPVGHTEGIKSAAFSPDNRYVITSSADKTIIIWDLQTGLELFRHAFEYMPTVAAFAPGGQQFLTVTNKAKDQLLLWDFSGGTPSVKLEINHPGSPLATAVFASNGQHIITVSTRGAINRWDAASGTLIKSIATNLSYVEAVDVSPDGQQIALADNKQVHIWDLLSGQKTLNLNGHPTTVLSLDFSPDGNSLASGDLFGQVFLWDASNGKQIYSKKERTNISALAFSQDGSYLAMPVTLGLQLLNLGDKTGKDTLLMPPSNIDVIRFSTDNQYILTAGSRLDPTVRIWDCKTGQLLRELKGYTSVSKLFPISSSEILSISSRNQPPQNGIALWNIKTGELTKQIQFNSYQITAAAVSKDKQKIALGLARMIFDETGKLKEEFCIQVFMIATWDTLAIFKGLNSSMGPMDFSPDGTHLLSCGGEILKPIDPGFQIEDLDSMGSPIDQDTNLYLWNIQKQKLERKIEGAKSAIRSAVFSPDGKLLLTGAANGKTQLWDIQTGKVLKSIFAGFPAIFINDGKQAAVRGGLTPLLIWDLKSHTTEAIPIPSKSYLTAIDYAADQQQLVLGTAAGEAFLWKLEQNQLQQQLQAHAQEINDITFLEGQQRYLTSSLGGTIKIWDRETVLPIATMVGLEKKDWLTYIPGFFYWGPKTATRKIGFAKGKNTFPFAQFDLFQNRPDKVIERISPDLKESISLYRKIILRRLKTHGLREIDTSTLHKPPQLILKNRNQIPLITKESHLRIPFQVNSFDSPLTNIYVSINDATIKHNLIIPKNTKSFEGFLHLPLSNEHNKIRMYAKDAKGLQSLGVSFDLERQGPHAKPDIYILSIGASTYQQQQYNLEYAAKDAKDFVELFKGKTDIYTSIHTMTITDHQVRLNELQKAKQWLQQSTINDIVLVHYAGHGVLADSLQLYLGAYDMDFSQPAKAGLSFEIMQDLFDNISARQKLLLLDACFTGELDREVVELQIMKAPKGEELQFRGMGAFQAKSPSSTLEFMKANFVDLRNQNGTVVIAGAGGTQLAFEGAEWENGAFTNCLIAGLKNNYSDLDGDGQIKISELQTYLMEIVPRTTKDRQKPAVRIEQIEHDWRIW